MRRTSGRVSPHALTPWAPSHVPILVPSLQNRGNPTPSKPPSLPLGFQIGQIAQGSPDPPVAAGWDLEMGTIIRMELPGPGMQGSTVPGVRSRPPPTGKSMGCRKAQLCLEAAVCTFGKGGGGRTVS